MAQMENARLPDENHKGASFFDSNNTTENIHILHRLKEDFKLVSGKNLFPETIFPPIIQKLIRDLESTLNFSPFRILCLFAMLRTGILIIKL